MGLRSREERGSFGVAQGTEPVRGQISKRPRLIVDQIIIIAVFGGRGRLSDVFNPGISSSPRVRRAHWPDAFRPGAETYQLGRSTAA